jgi:hypothetical protein
LYNEGKLTLESGCKGYQSYVTLYAVSTSIVNVTSDYVPIAPVNFDNCFDDLKTISFEKLPFHTHLVNISSLHDLIPEEAWKHVPPPITPAQSMSLTSQSDYKTFLSEPHLLQQNAINSNSYCNAKVVTSNTLQIKGQSTSDTIQ